MCPTRPTPRHKLNSVSRTAARKVYQDIRRDVRRDLIRVPIVRDEYGWLALFSMNGGVMAEEILAGAGDAPW
jgi:hypothetical protein